jgi:RNA polymerase sigma factor (sigma-70 family)
MDDAKVYQEVQHELMRLATALVGPSDAEDVVSTVVARVLERSGGLSGLDDPRPYLVKAVINEARSRYRTARRWDIQELSEDDLPTVDYRDYLVDVVKQLPPRQRAATFLVYWEGHTATKAAELMGCRPATLRRYLHLAHKKLRESIGD